MKKHIKIIILYFLLIFSLLFVFCGQSTEKKAKDLIELGMYEQAEVILKNEINKNPKNAELHFLLGKCLLTKNDIEGAQESFNRATILDTKKGKEIGKAYLDEAISAFNKDELRRADTFFSLSVKYDPSLKSSIGNHLFEKAKLFILKEDLHSSKRLFDLALNYDSNLKKEITDLLLKEGTKSLEKNNNEISIRIFSEAYKYDSNLNVQISKILLEKAIKIFEERQIEKANELFSQASRYDSSTKTEISKIYINAAIANIDSLKEFELFSNKAISYDPNSCIDISKKAFEKAKTLSRSYNNIEKILLYGKLATTIKGSNPEDWGNLIFDMISNNTSNLDIKESINIFSQALKWNPNLKNKISELYLNKAVNYLKSKNVNSAGIYLTQAVSDDITIKNKAFEIVWQEILPNVPQLTTIGKSDFILLLDLCNKFGVPKPVESTLEYKYVNALSNYYKGDKLRAINIFKTISSQYSDTPYGKKAKKILSPPSPQKKDINENPIIYTVTYWDRYDNFLIKLTDLEVKINSVVLTFSIKNSSGNKIYLLYNIKTNLEWNYEAIHIKDDLGRKFYATSDVTNTNSKIADGKARMIDFEPNDEFTVTLTFPMISEGATQINFVSPELSTWFPKWEWRNIVLKDDPLDL